MEKNAFKHYEVGIFSMDSEHWVLLEGIKEVHALVGKGLVQAAHKKIAELTALLLEHFSHEEALMRQINFPYLAYHIKDHLRVLSLLQKIYKDFPQTDYHKDCVMPVERLMVTHFDTMDSQYVPFHEEWLLKNVPEGQAPPQ